MSAKFPIPYPPDMYPEAKFAVGIVPPEDAEKELREAGYSEEAIKENLAEIERIKQELEK